MTQPPPAQASAGSTPWLALTLTGLIGGLLSGAFGVGGGIVMVPLLITLAGFDQRRASATSLAAIVPTALASSITYFANGQVDLAAALFLALGGIVGSYVGALFLRRIPLTWLRWAFIALIVAAAVRLAFIVPPRGDGDISLTWWSALGLVGIGLLLGVASGLFGIGGGVIAVPALIVLFGAGDLVAKGTSLAMMVPTAISGTVANVRGGLVDLRAGLLVGIAATIASFGGVALAFCMPPALSAALFAGLLLVAAAQLAVKAVRAQRAARV